MVVPAYNPSAQAGVGGSQVGEKPVMHSEPRLKENPKSGMQLRFRVLSYCVQGLGSSLELQEEIK
jgi:hypothetical protein